MKIVTLSLLTLVLSNLIFIPTTQNYKSKNDFENNRSIVYKEKKLEYLIQSIEYRIKKDSLEIEVLQMKTK
jgi:hypothetical protein